MAEEIKANVKKTTEYLRYDFSAEEFAAHARELARLNQELARFVDHKKQITANLAADQKQKESDVADASRLVSNGYEYRDVACEVRYHDPENGKKTVIRLDTGEIVKTVFMSGDEMQEPLPFDQQAEKAPESA